MGAAGPLLAYTGLVFVLAGTLSYPLYLLLQFWDLTPVSFPKVVQTALKLSALVALWPLMKWCGLASRANWGYGMSGRRLVTGSAAGLLGGVGSLGALVAILCLLQVRVPSPAFEITVWAFLGAVAKAAVAALIIGFVEETWFRGALHSVVAQATTGPRAVWVTAILFGIVHFIRADPASLPADPSWSAGFSAIAHSFHRFADSGFIDSFLALTVAGLLLGLLRHRNGHIGHCIGVHAGWVIVGKVTRGLSEANPDSPYTLLVGSYDGVIGYLACLWLGLLGLVYYRLGHRRAARGTA